MAGMSSRFLKAGYIKPKYMLEAHGFTLFEHAVNSFKKYFNKESFLFIVKDIFDTPSFVTKCAKSLGIKDFHIVVLDKETRGQAETVTLGLKALPDFHGSITIFNIDTFRPGFTYPDLSNLGRGFLEVFEGEGSNWSFVKAVNKESTQVCVTAEKKAISNLCCTGLYYFASSDEYLDAYNHYINLPQEQWENGELYVAPLYNFLINVDKEIHFHLIKRSEVIFCGVPKEYIDFLNRIF